MNPEPELAAVLRLATVADATGIAETHVASWQATYPGIVPQAYLNRMQVQDFAERWRDRLSSSAGMSLYVAERAGLICGFAAGGPARLEIAGCSGELYAIYLRPEACSQGIGTRLFQAVAERLELTGYAGLYVWVLEDNPSRRFYERRGGLQLSSAVIEIGGKTLTEVSYGWATTGKPSA